VLPEHKRTMFLTKYAQQNNLTNAKFIQELATLEPLYSTAANGAQAEMLLVGKIGEYKRHYGRQSPEWKFYDLILTELDIDKSKVSRLTTAYNFYNKHENCSVYGELMRSATPHQLYALKMGESKKSSVVVDAVKHLTKTGKVPSVNLINKRISNRVGADFKEVEKVAMLQQTPTHIDEDTLRPAKDEVPSEYSIRSQKAQELVDNPEYRYISSFTAGMAYLNCTGPDSIAATMQRLSRLTTCDEKQYKQMRELIRLAQQVMELPSTRSITVSCK
jgi:hypothetical protein